jgi:hypothetical protein
MVYIYHYMKKFIITEEEKSRILNLYEKVGEPLSAEGLSSQKADYTKKVAKVLNTKYGLNLTTATTGDWQNTDYNNALKKFMEENGIPVHTCKSNDGWCGPNTDGEVTAGNQEDSDKLSKALFGDNQTEKINTTNDKDYDYKFSNNKYYFKGKEGRPSATKYPNWVEATGKGLESIKKNVKF